MIPLKGETIHSNLCLDRYFEERELITTSISDELPVLFQDFDNMVFDDILLIETQKSLPLEEKGRLEILESIFQSYKSSLKSPYGSCDLKLLSGEKEISFEVFQILAREEGGQPGTRRMLTKDDVSQPNWQVFCSNSSGEKILFKSGTYFFVFVDIYENKTLQNTSAHLAKFLFSFR